MVVGPLEVSVSRILEAKIHTEPPHRVNIWLQQMTIGQHHRARQFGGGSLAQPEHKDKPNMTINHKGNGITEPVTIKSTRNGHDRALPGDCTISFPSETERGEGQ